LYVVEVVESWSSAASEDREVTPGVAYAAPRISVIGVDVGDHRLVALRPSVEADVVTSAVGIVALAGRTNTDPMT
jgi:hypothetical protein